MNDDFQYMDSNVIDLFLFSSSSMVNNADKQVLPPNPRRIHCIIELLAML